MPENKEGQTPAKDKIKDEQERMRPVFGPSYLADILKAKPKKIQIEDQKEE